jgi:putative spermidine/putrescine transport system ATP-binding protein
MFQSYAVFPHLSCVDNVAFSVKMRGVEKETCRSRAPRVTAPSSRWTITPSACAIIGRSTAARFPGSGAHHGDGLGYILAHKDAGGTASSAAAARYHFCPVMHSQDEAMALADLVVVIECRQN